MGCGGNSRNKKKIGRSAKSGSGGVCVHARACGRWEISGSRFRARLVMGKGGSEWKFGWKREDDREVGSRADRVKVADKDDEKK